MSELNAKPSQIGPLADRLPLLRDGPWQMSYGERATLVGVASQLRPRLAIEIGTAEGGSLEALAPHCEEFHSFDLVKPTIDLDRYGNVTVHTGDSHDLLPGVLAGFAEQARRVDFALVDGDHTAEGVRRDVEALLDSDAVGEALILIHDTANGVVREGVEAIAWEKHPIAYLDLDFVGGYVFRKPPYAGEMWGGLGLVIVRDCATADAGGTGPRQDARYPAFDLLADGWRAYAARERKLARLGGLAAPGSRTVAELERVFAEAHERLESCQQELAAARALNESVVRSASWRMTAPLRELKRHARRGR